MNRKLFLLDTNIYRRLVEIVKENRYQGNNFIIAEIKDKEDNTEIPVPILFHLPINSC